MLPDNKLKCESHQLNIDLLAFSKINLDCVDSKEELIMF